MLLEQIAFTAVIIASFVSVLFVLSVIIKRNDIADVAWGTGIFSVALINYFTGSMSQLSLILTIIAGLWGVRLTVRILLRNLKKSEDFRYRKWREEWGKVFYIRSYFQVYLLQGFLMVVVGYPFIHLNVYGEGFSFGTLFYIGAVVWMIGYFFEVVGDFQLDKFIKNKTEKDAVLDTGLWRYTRHPNYFGEVTMWWGVWLMVVTLPFGLFIVISPLTITYLILKVSGIPMLEKGFADNPAFQEYKKRTSAFFPLPPKNDGF